MSKEGYLQISGKICSGRGLAKTERNYELEKLRKLLDINIINGSLNVVSKKPVHLNPSEAFFNHNGHYFWHARLNKKRIILNRWVGAPAHIFEIYSDVQLRKHFNLSDNGQVQLLIPYKIVNILSSNSRINNALWAIFWLGRETSFYSDSYFERLERRQKSIFWKCMKRSLQNRKSK